MQIDPKVKSNISYRASNNDDFDEIEKFCLTALNEPKLPDFARDIGEELIERIDNQADIDVIVAEDTTQNNKIIGYAEIQTKPRNEGEVHYIKGIYVLPEFRGRGIGMNLVDLLLETSPAADQVAVISLSEKMMKFWKKNGFTVDSWMMTRSK